MHRWVGRQTQIDKQAGRQVPQGKQADQKTDRQADRYRWEDRQSDRQVLRQMCWADIYTDKKIDRQTSR